MAADGPVARAAGALTAPPPWEGFSEPFNGQAARREAILRLAAEFKPDAWIETGTFLGHTTRFLAEQGPPVYTVEIDPAWFRLAKRSLRRHSNLTMICGDSVEGLRLLLDREDFSRPFFYLDAHWFERLPLAEEVSLILAGWEEAIIVIDDFLVPGQPGYGYDILAGVPLSSELLELPADAALAYPTIPAVEETGARRGTGYIAWGTGAKAALARLGEEGVLSPAAASTGVR